MWIFQKRSLKLLLFNIGENAYICKAHLKYMVAEAGAVDRIFIIWDTQTGHVQQFHKDDWSFGKGVGVEGWIYCDPIKLCMLGSKLENEALIWSGKLIYWILWFRFIHFLIHNSASVSFCPSVVPYLLVVPKDLSGGGIAAEFIRLFFAATCWHSESAFVTTWGIGLLHCPSGHNDKNSWWKGKKMFYTVQKQICVCSFICIF